MTKSIFEKMSFSVEHEEILNYATSDKYLEKIKKIEKAKKNKNYKVVNEMSAELKTALASL